MDITDIPDQISKAFRYSLRSPSTFSLSFLTAVLVFGIGYDLLYSFWYTRWHNVKDPSYGAPYLAGLVLVALVAPLTIGVVAYLRARAQASSFKPGQIGIAIAPFEVFSVAPETLGTANVLQALDIVSTQFFRVVENTLSEYEAARELNFRFLPPYISIASKQQALEYRERLNATLVIWGSITQRSRQPLEVRLNVQAQPHTYDFSNLSIEEFPMLPLQYFMFLEAGKAALKGTDILRAQRLLEQARLLGAELDKRKPMNFESSARELLNQLPGGPPPQASKAEAPSP